MKKRLFPILITIAIIILWFVGYKTYAKVQTVIKELQSQTITWQLEQVKKEARELEAKQEEYRKLNIEWKLDELYRKSTTLQSLGKTQ